MTARYACLLAFAALAAGCGQLARVAPDASPPDATANTPDASPGDGAEEAPTPDAPAYIVVSDGPPQPPTPAKCVQPRYHRPSAVACSTTRPPGVNLDGGVESGGGAGAPCTNDSQCVDAGVNARCTPGGPGMVNRCEPDMCFTDTDCSGDGTCECGTRAPYGRYANTCLPGNCRVDSDCTECGYCSPAYIGCMKLSGTSTLTLTGYYCHTPADLCTNDRDCADAGPGAACIYQSVTERWECANLFCAG